MSRRLLNPQHDADALAASLRATGFETVTVVSDTTARKTDRRPAHVCERGGKGRLGRRLLFGTRHGGERHQLSHPGRGEDRHRPRRAVRSDPARPGDGLGRRREEAEAGPARRLPRQPVRAADAPHARRAKPWPPRPRPAAASSPRARSAAASARSKCPARRWSSMRPNTARPRSTAKATTAPFAIAVVQRIATPNVEINKLFRLVRDDVMEATAGQAGAIYVWLAAGAGGFLLRAEVGTASTSTPTPRGPAAICVTRVNAAMDDTRALMVCLRKDYEEEPR